MKKAYDDFIKLSTDKMAQEMSDITSQYKNTIVPKSHYKKFLETGTEQFIECTVDLSIVDVYFKQIKRLFEDNPSAFIRSLICIDNKLNPTNMRPNDYKRLELTISQINKSDFKFINQDIQAIFDNSLTFLDNLYHLDDDDNIDD